MNICVSIITNIHVIITPSKKTWSISRWRTSTHFEPPFKIFDSKEKHRIVPRSVILAERDEIEARRSVLVSRWCIDTRVSRNTWRVPFRKSTVSKQAIRGRRINGGESRLTDKPNGGETLIDSHWLATRIGGDAVFAHFISIFRAREYTGTPVNALKYVHFIFLEKRGRVFQPSTPTPRMEYGRG